MVHLTAQGYREGMSGEAVADIAMLIVFVVATVVYLKFGGKEYEYNDRGELVEAK